MVMAEEDGYVDPVSFLEATHQGENWADNFLDGLAASGTPSQSSGQDGCATSTQLFASTIEGAEEFLVSWERSDPPCSQAPAPTPTQPPPTIHTPAPSAHPAQPATPSHPAIVAQPPSATLNISLGHQTTVNHVPNPSPLPNRSPLPNPSPIPNANPSPIPCASPSVSTSLTSALPTALASAKTVLAPQQGSGLAAGLGPVNVLQLTGSTVPVHTLLSGPGHLPGSSQTTLLANPLLQQTHSAPGLVNQQNAVLQNPGAVIPNPNMVNVNVAQLLCNSQQNGLQGVPVSVGAAGAQMPTVIQTPQGIIIANHSQRFNLGLQQVGMFPQQLNLSPQLNMGTSQQANSVISFAPAPGAFAANNKNNPATSAASSFNNQHPIMLQLQGSPLIVQQRPAQTVLVPSSVPPTASSASSGTLHTSTANAQNLSQLQFLQHQGLQLLGPSLSVANSSMSVQQVQALPIMLQNGKQVVQGPVGLQDSTQQSLTSVTLMPASGNSRTTSTTVVPAAPLKAATPTNILDEALISSGIVCNGDSKPASKKRKRNNAQTKTTVATTVPMPRPTVSMQISTVPNPAAQGAATSQVSTRLPVPLLVQDQVSGGLKTAGVTLQTPQGTTIRPNAVGTPFVANTVGGQKLITLIATSTNSTLGQQQGLTVQSGPLSAASLQTLVDNRNGQGSKSDSIYLSVSSAPSITCAATTMTGTTTTSVLQSAPAISFHSQPANSVLITSQAVTDQPKVILSQSFDGRLLQPQTTESPGQMQLKQDRIKPFLPLSQGQVITTFNTTNPNHTIVQTSGGGLQPLPKLSLGAVQVSAPAAGPQSAGGHPSSHMPTVVVKMATSADSNLETGLPLNGQSGAKLVLPTTSQAGKLPLPIQAPSSSTQIKIPEGVLTFSLNSQSQPRLVLQSQSAAQSSATSALMLPKGQTQGKVILAPASKALPIPVQRLDGSSTPSIVTTVCVTSSITAVTTTTTTTTTTTAAASTSTSQSITSSTAVIQKPLEKATVERVMQTQLSKDQSHALYPDTKTPFANDREACRRLLRYHVCQSADASQETMDQFDKSYQGASEDLIAQKGELFMKLRSIMMDESKTNSFSAEQVMLERLQLNEIKQQFNAEKVIAKDTPEAFVPMPEKFLHMKHMTKKAKRELRKKVELGETDSAELDGVSDSEEEAQTQPPKPRPLGKLVIRNTGGDFFIAIPSPSNQHTSSRSPSPSPSIGKLSRKSQDNHSPKPSQGDLKVTCKTEEKEHCHGISRKRSSPIVETPVTGYKSSLNLGSSPHRESDDSMHRAEFVPPSKRKKHGLPPASAQQLLTYNSLDVVCQDLDEDNLDTSMPELNPWSSPGPGGDVESNQAPSHFHDNSQQQTVGGVGSGEACSQNSSQDSSSLAFNFPCAQGQLQQPSSFPTVTEYSMDEAPSLAEDSSEFNHQDTDSFNLQEVDLSDTAATLEHAQSNMAMEFDLDKADPQKEMVNDQMQNAIASIISPTPLPGSSASDAPEAFDAGNSNLFWNLGGDTNAGMDSTTEQFQGEMPIEDDLEVAVNSIVNIM